MHYPFFQKILFKFDPEHIHDLILQLLNFVMKTPLATFIRQEVPEKPVVCMGLTFKNPIGLAAGLDKNGRYIDALGALGFGFIEIGTVTPCLQLGNDKPRLFRLPEAEALINRMGFNNNGVDCLIENIRQNHFSGILGINIGKNKDTPIEEEVNDYLICMEKVYTYADYIVINISSPNTPGLRRMHYGEVLDILLASVKKKQNVLRTMYQKYVPLTIKISPDLSDDELAQVADSLVRYNIDGVIATNTTIDRSLIYGMHHYNESGGLSGCPLHLKSTKVIHRLSNELHGQLPIIGVGGINSVISAREKIAAGATLIQIYSGLIYKGPSLIKKIAMHI